MGLFSGISWVHAKTVDWLTDVLHNDSSLPYAELDALSAKSVNQMSKEDVDRFFILNGQAERLGKSVTGDVGVELEKSVENTINSTKQLATNAYAPIGREIKKVGNEVVGFAKNHRVLTGFAGGAMIITGGTIGGIAGGFAGGSALPVFGIGSSIGKMVGTASGAGIAGASGGLLLIKTAWTGDTTELQKTIDTFAGAKSEQTTNAVTNEEIQKALGGKGKVPNQTVPVKPANQNTSSQYIGQTSPVGLIIPLAQGDKAVSR